jgi:hypothetical protein
LIARGEVIGDGHEALAVIMPGWRGEAEIGQDLATVADADCERVTLYEAFQMIP